MKPGCTFHGLQILSFCGEGAFGAVYLCRDMTGISLAVNIIPKRKLDKNATRELKGLSHYRKITENTSNLLQIFHVEEDAAEDIFFYTMEPADPLAGTAEYQPDTLAARLSYSGPLPDDVVYPVLSGICNGIKAIHKAGFAHRDIKPDNILFVHGIPKLGDPGLMSSTENSVTGLAGTWEFIPPEIRSSDHPDSCTGKSQDSDLYAFGKVIYCAISGQHPQNFPSLPNSRLQSLPAKYFMQLAFRLCDRDPKHRINSIAALDREMTKIRRKLRYGENWQDRLSYRISRAAGAIFRKSVLLPLAVLACAAAGWYLWSPYRKTAQAQPAVSYKNHINPILKYAITIPADWNVMTVESIKTELEKKLKNKEISSKEVLQRIEQMRPMLTPGSILMQCDYQKPYLDSCFITSIPLQGVNLLDTPNDILFYQFTSAFRERYGDQTLVYEVEKIRIAGKPGICVTYSELPGIRKNYYYVIPHKKYNIAISFNLKTTTAEMRKKQIDTAMKTLTFFE